jgi:hypothetical protein
MRGLVCVLKSDGPLTTPGDFASMDNFKLARRAAKAHNLQPASARHVLLAVAVYINGSPARAGYERLADDTGLSVVQVRNLIALLVKAGYLVMERGPKPAHGGWGQPQWHLGPLCQVLPGQHLQVLNGQQSQEQVLPTQQSSAAEPALASAARPAQKRRGTEENLEEKGATPPKPPAPAELVLVEPNGTRVGDYVAYLSNHGQKALADALTPADKKYLAGQSFDITDFAACVVATAAGTWPGADEWIKTRMSVRNIHQHRYPRWVTKGTPTAESVITPGGVTDAMVRWARSRQAREEAAHAHDHPAVSRALPPPRAGL